MRLSLFLVVLPRVPIEFSRNGAVIAFLPPMGRVASYLSGASLFAKQIRFKVLPKVFVPETKSLSIFPRHQGVEGG
jgi:hypothetical protein